MRSLVMTVLLLTAPACGLTLDPDPANGMDTGPGADGAPGDAPIPNDQGMTDVVAPDAEPPPDATDGCIAVEEVCNGLDDDCDDLVDEGFDTVSDPANCGACGSVCGPIAGQMALCQGGVCMLTCLPGFDDCNGTPSDGCETDLGGPGNCGRCGGACRAGEVCDYDVCANECDLPMTNCSGSCVDLNASLTHCGACGSTCTAASGTPACLGGSCEVIKCPPPTKNCDNDTANGCETNILRNPAHCGACYATCGPGEICNTGMCMAPMTTPCSSVSDWSFALSALGCDGTCGGNTITCTPGGVCSCTNAAGGVGDICIGDMTCREAATSRCCSSLSP